MKNGINELMEFIHKSLCLYLYTLNNLPEFDTLPIYEETRIFSSKIELSYYK